MVNFVGLIALAHVGPEINEPQQPMLSRIPSKNLNKIKKQNTKQLSNAPLRVGPCAILHSRSLNRPDNSSDVLFQKGHKGVCLKGNIKEKNVRP